MNAHLKILSMAHVEVVEELGLIFPLLVAILVLLMENAQVAQVLYVVLLVVDLHDI